MSIKYAWYGKIWRFSSKKARKGFWPLGNWIFSKFLEFFEKLFLKFSDFLGVFLGIFLEFFGGPFWEGFFTWMWKKFIYLSRFCLNKEGRRKDKKSRYLKVRRKLIAIKNWVWNNLRDIFWKYFLLYHWGHARLLIELANLAEARRIICDRDLEGSLKTYVKNS